MVAKSKGGYHIGNLDSSIETYAVITQSSQIRFRGLPKYIDSNGGDWNINDWFGLAWLRSE